MSKKTFKGGVHPYEGKELSRDKGFRSCPAGQELIFPLGGHIGKPAVPLVKKNDRVLAGQKLAEANGFMSANVICSCSGAVKSIEKRPDVSGKMTMCIIVENDEAYEKTETPAPKRDINRLSTQDILERVVAAGITGMGGAGFPTHVKLAPEDTGAINHIMVNGAECEPYITCDDQLMRNFSDEIVRGLEVMLRMFPNAVGEIVIEENKPEAISAMSAACAGHDRISVYPVETKYPQGGERSIISVITGRHLKLGMLPKDVGCIVENVATVRAIYRAVCLGEPLIERGFTVSGEGVAQPCNLIVKLGTPFSKVLEAAGGYKEGVEPAKLLCGGSMMGIAMPGLEAGVWKNHNALTVLSQDPAAEAEAQMTECIRCGRCNQACPLGLSPQLMAAAAKKRDYERYEKKLYGLDCIACGSCTFICPAKRPLMQVFKQAKAEIMGLKRKQGEKK